MVSEEMALYFCRYGVVRVINVISTIHCALVKEVIDKYVHKKNKTRVLC
jgi:hypothetical protein